MRCSSSRRAWPTLRPESLAVLIPVCKHKHYIRRQLHPPSSPDIQQYIPTRTVCDSLKADYPGPICTVSIYLDLAYTKTDLWHIVMLTASQLYL
jgi:hypothetical protein